jgi:alpha,alpha-trehalase
LGLVGSAHEQLIEDMTENMAYLLGRFGLIPNASRYYFLSRSQPPFFTQMMWLAYESKVRRGHEDARSFLARMLGLAAAEHEIVWLGKAQPHHRLVHEGLSRYFDINYLDMLASCESGWDHSTRCADRWLEHLPVDLNSILYRREMDMARAADLLGQHERATAWRSQAEGRAATMRRLMWSDEAGFFFDYNFVAQRIDPTPTLAGFYPMWAGVATDEQAARMVDGWLMRFEHAGGLVASLTSQTGRQWAYPNGWAPLQWVVATGLERTGFADDAMRLREKWCRTCTRAFATSGVLWEKYNVVEPEAAGEGGLYGHVTGFGWTNGVFVDFARRLLASVQ